jgi:hypothetical protein
MHTKYQLLESVPFVEFSSVKVTDSFNPLFDIEKVPEENIEIYSQNLINKIFQLKHSEIPDFIDQHCNLVNNAMTWLNKFEKLISVNEELFRGAKNEIKLMKFCTCIELKRNEMKSLAQKESLTRPHKKQINAECEDRYFSFKELREKLNLLEVFEEKIMLLTNEKYNYQQSNIDFVNKNLPDFDKQCDKEIEHLYEMKKLQEQLKTVVRSTTSQNVISGNQIRVYCNMNQLVDVFFQLNRELFIEGKPFLDANTNDFVALICNNFVDKEGHEISPATVETILRPSKYDKRPKSHKRIDVNKLI